jgi:hypothetical protein
MRQRQQEILTALEEMNKADRETLKILKEANRR